MGAFDEINNLPISSAAYNSWVNGWVFGADSSGETCGAMPFRRGTGKYSERCLRGEDWAFLASVCSCYSTFPASGVWNKGSLPLSPSVTARVDRQAAVRMYEWLYAVQQLGCYGEDFDMRNTAVETGSSVEQEAANHMTGLMQIESDPVQTTVSVSLSLSRIKTFFKDTKKMMCTVGIASYTWEDSTSSHPDIHGYLYRFEDAYSTSGYPKKGTQDITNVKFDSTLMARGTQKVGIDGMVLLPVRTDETHSGVTTRKYALVAVGPIFEMTNSQSHPYEYTASISVSGQQIANLASSATGMNLEPRATSSDRITSAQVSIEGSNLIVLWPKWLIDYE